ncbi:hypothetical protein TVAG_191130 [Trichomonas vaginalis G3]|uniref:Uncharacterized protein n=1 Tax=Trichomonas vaginalis (strain ATCC PRA-98 / G3) TaxID=412133 RepID=A2EFJ6_TRIV3|nr:hypothetical protein TVAGG3_0821010 [Trichomonas vaginalis G3]EAY08590.1 hypothetical protein TVAG_191130 [Trichomonas vaginalis G3]KAI5497891.1 hypothetical protein TVAGG3_0821010 [Trichomonas vaginalis G3]|eukprot:XP_001320813.1 hypothetical protein [Trichomonas vaginalis G3]
MTKVFPPEYYGIIFHVNLYKGENKTKDVQRAHVYTSKDSITIMSNDWKTNIATVPTLNVENVEAKGDLEVLLRARGDPKPIFYLFETSKKDKLTAALKPEFEKTSKPIVFKSESVILPTFMESIPSSILLDNSQKLAQLFFSTFSNKNNIQSFYDMIICLYRLRFSNEKAGAYDKNFPLLVATLRRELLFNWYVALARACRFKVEPNAFEYFVRIIINTSADIATVSETLSIQCTELLNAITEMSENGRAESIIQSAEVLRAKVAMKSEQDYKEIPPPNQNLCDLMIKVALVLFCGVQVNTFNVDIERLTVAAIDFAMACHNKIVTDDSFKTLKKALEAYTMELLRFMDARRYDPEFHFVFIAFSIVDEIKRMKFEFK